MRLDVGLTELDEPTVHSSSFRPSAARAGIQVAFRGNDWRFPQSAGFPPGSRSAGVTFFRGNDATWGDSVPEVPNAVRFFQRGGRRSNAYRKFSIIIRSDSAWSICDQAM